MEQTGWDRRGVLWGLSAIAGAGILGARVTPATAQQVKYSSGTEPPKLKAPANACDCHHHIYGSQYKVDPRSTLRPGDATVEDYRALQKRIGTSRNVIVQPSTYGTENAPTLDALVAFGPNARAVVVVDTTVTDAELKRMHGLGARGIRFNLAQAGATTQEMIEPLSKRVNELGWHIQINASPATIMEIMPILEKVPLPIVFDHLAHIPEPEGISHPLFGQVRALRGTGSHRRGGHDVGDAHPFALDVDIALLHTNGLRDDISASLYKDLAAVRGQSVDSRLDVGKIRVPAIRWT